MNQIKARSLALVGLLAGLLAFAGSSWAGPTVTTKVTNTGISKKMHLKGEIKELKDPSDPKPGDKVPHRPGGAGPDPKGPDVDPSDPVPGDKVPHRPGAGPDPAPDWMTIRPSQLERYRYKRNLDPNYKPSRADLDGRVREDAAEVENLDSGETSSEGQAGGSNGEIQDETDREGSGMRLLGKTINGEMNTKGCVLPGPKALKNAGKYGKPPH